MINKFGAVKSFRIGGVVTAIVVFIFLMINYAVNRDDQKTVKKDVEMKLKSLGKNEKHCD